VVGEKYNMLYGGLNMRGSSILFTYNVEDLLVELMSVSGDVTNDVYVYRIEGWSMGNDLEEESEEDSKSLIEVRTRAIERMTEWITDTQNTCNGRGNRILNECKCKSGWEGNSCNETFVNYEMFWQASGLAAGILTFAILSVGVFTWHIFLGIF
jgi:hypothetical protein